MTLILPITQTHPPLSSTELPRTIGPISIFVENSHEFTSNEVSLLENFGAVTTIAGPIAVLHTTATELSEIERLPFITRVENSHALSIDAYDVNVADVGAPMVWNEVRDPSNRNVTGTGVIIGFVDTGIDTTHPDFSFPNGTTKILYVWDQTTPGRAPAGFNYGFECTSTDIQARTCPEKDTYGHGTHVAGIAASSGMATGNYTGVAPGASIIFVKSGFSLCDGNSWTFYTSQILDGVNYIVNKAKQLGMRAVISLSLGGNIGAHDGTDPLELGLNAIVNSGIPVVVAAGNEARDNDHIHGQLLQGSNVTFQLQLRETTIDLQVDVWYSPQDQITATLTTPDGQNYPVPTKIGGANSTYGNVTTTTGSDSKGKELYLEVNSTSSLPADGWTVTLKANQISSQGLWDAWTDAVTCSFPGSQFIPGDGYAVDPNETIGIPGTAEDVITVGAYVTKAYWIGMNGQTYGRTDIPPGRIASFSSRGPTRDGRVKPDVVAPGALIASARSNTIPSQAGDPDPFHRILAGTSMATPHVAGVVALMLQYAPTLQTLEISRILRETARLDNYTRILTDGSPVWGFGKADARTATGLFRLTLIPNDIASSLVVPIQEDNATNLQLFGDSWAYVYFEKGTTHLISFEPQIQGRPGTRYELQNSSLQVASNYVGTLNYTVQYLLTVNSPYEPITGAGWYNSNASAPVSAPDHVRASGLLGYIGAENVIAYWVTDDGKTFTNSVVMSSPETVEPIYVLTFPLETLALVIFALSATLVLVVIIARKFMS